MILLLACADEPVAPAATPPGTSSITVPTGSAGDTRTPPAAIPIPAEEPKAPRKCGPGPSTPKPEGCVTGRLSCGAKVEGTTEGGTRRVVNERYTSAFCWPATVGNHDAPERGYRFEVPAYTDVVIEMSSPCVDLDLAAMAWDWTGACPSDTDIISVCEAGTKSGGDRVHLQVFNPREYFVLVDGKDGAVGPYTLSVTCKPLRRPGEK